MEDWRDEDDDLGSMEAWSSTIDGMESLTVEDIEMEGVEPDELLMTDDDIETVATVEIEPSMTVSFELGEDIRDEKRQEQDAKWASAVADGRGHYSHREYALIHGHAAKGAIRGFYVVKLLIQFLYRKIGLSPYTVAAICDYAYGSHGKLVLTLIDYEDQMNFIHRPSHSDISLTTTHTTSSACAQVAEDCQDNELFQLFVRKRPLQSFELSQGCYDTTNVNSTHGSILLHDFKSARNNRQHLLTHHFSHFHRVYDGEVDNDMLSSEIIDPMLSLCDQGRNSTIMMFGQTGTGKTYTMTGLLTYLSQRLIGRSIKIRFFEIYGNKCADLLNDRHIIHLRSDGQDNIHIRNCMCYSLAAVTDPEEIMSIVSIAMTLRRHIETERNPISSRSHAICIFDIEGINGQWNSITLVDLAGSERNYETIQMTRQEHLESAQINYSLMSLKDCFRLYHDSLQQGPQQPPVYIPFRSCLLTRFLKDCFDIKKRQKTILVTTISPSPIDIAHSLNSLNHVSMMCSDLADLNFSISLDIPMYGIALGHIPVEEWTSEHVQAFLAMAYNGRFSELIVPPNVTGARLLELNTGSLASLFAGNLRLARTDNEGEAWVIAAADEGNSNNKFTTLANALYSALKHENTVAKSRAIDHHDMELNL